MVERLLFFFRRTASTRHLVHKQLAVRRKREANNPLWIISSNWTVAGAPKIKFNKASPCDRIEGGIRVKFLFLHRFILYLIMNLSVVKWREPPFRSAPSINASPPPTPGIRLYNFAMPVSSPHPHRSLLFIRLFFGGLVHVEIKFGTRFYIKIIFYVFTSTVKFHGASSPHVATDAHNMKLFHLLPSVNFKWSIISALWERIGRTKTPSWVRLNCK